MSSMEEKVESEQVEGTTGGGPSGGAAASTGLTTFDPGNKLYWSFRCATSQKEAAGDGDDPEGGTTPPAARALKRTYSRKRARGFFESAMEAPLLHQPTGEGERGSPAEQPQEWEGDCPPVKGWGDAWEVFTVESRKLWRIALPIVFNILCLYGINSVTQIFAGHIGNLELSAVAIGLSVVSNFSFGFMLGMGSVLETLCGQAFGADQVRMLGIYLQRSLIILTVSAAVLSPLYVFATPILKLIGQRDDIAGIAGRFTLLILPQNFAVAINFPIQKFLQAQSKVAALAWIGAMGLLLHTPSLFLSLYVCVCRSRRGRPPPAAGPLSLIPLSHCPSLSLSHKSRATKSFPNVKLI